MRLPAREGVGLCLPDGRIHCRRQKGNVGPPARVFFVRQALGCLLYPEPLICARSSRFADDDLNYAVAHCLPSALARAACAWRLRTS